MGKKSSATVPSKISSVGAPAVPSGTPTTQKSSILKAAFTPSNFQLRLFASVIQSFESQQLRIHDTSSGRLRCQHVARPGIKITSLDWGYYGPSYREHHPSNSKKKRKRERNMGEDGVLAYGTDSSEICMFSPTEAKIVGTLAGVHDRGIRDFKFVQDNYLEGWSLGGDGRLVQWDLNKGQAIRTISLPDPSISTLGRPGPSLLLCASSTPFTVDLESSDDVRIESFDSFKGPIHSLCRSGVHDVATPEYFLAADADRYINVYDMSHQTLVRTLVAGSGVVGVDMWTPASEGKDGLHQQMLAVLTKDGVVELFAQPFVPPARINGDLKSSKKNLTKKASAQVRLTGPGAKTKLVPVFSASLQGPELLVAFVDGGVDLSFQKIRWQDEATGELLFDGLKDVVRVKSASTLNTATLNGVKDMGQSHIDESRTVVVSGGTSASQDLTIEITSSDEEDEEAESSSNEEEPEQSEGPGMRAVEAEQEFEADSDNDSEVAQDLPGDDDQGIDEAAESQSAAEPEEPTFGELLAWKHQSPISIADALKPETSAVVLSDGARLSIPSGMSMGTVLTQSLRTNDRNLLESCLHTTDVDVVKNTIQRLDSSLAGILLSKLAERLASRPGRYGHLITWVQWTCIAHGGAIAAQPDVAGQVRSLYGILTERARSLDNLLLLKGKLDMLGAQLTFRKQLQAQRSAVHGGSGHNVDEPGMIYIEGQDDNWSSDEDLDEAAHEPRAIQAKRRKPARRDFSHLVADDESSEDDEIPVANGISHSDAEDEENDSDSDAGAHRPRGSLIDDDVEVTGEDESDSNDEGGEAIDLSEDEEDDDDDNDEDDSEMEDFINDGTISEVEEEDDVDVDDEDEDDTPRKPATKKSKFR